jgi:hypothetical protein
VSALAAAALSMVLNAHCGMSDTLNRIAAGIVMRENPKLDAAVINHNANGTDDHGLTQVNTVNYGWLSKAMHKPINDQTIMDRCTNLEAGLRVQFVRYNGNPPETVAAAYSTLAMNSAMDVDATGEVKEANYTVSIQKKPFDPPIRSPPQKTTTIIFMRPTPGRSLVLPSNTER